LRSLQGALAASLSYLLNLVVDFFGAFACCSISIIRTQQHASGFIVLERGSLGCDRALLYGLLLVMMTACQIAANTDTTSTCNRMQCRNLEDVHRVVIVAYRWYRGSSNPWMKRRGKNKLLEVVWRKKHMF
jgi:hypothetical protein